MRASLPRIRARSSRHVVGGSIDRRRQRVVDRARHAPSLERDYVTTIRDWRGHDVAICKNAMEVRRHLLTHAGLRNVTASREKCQSWGHEACLTRMRWD